MGHSPWGHKELDMTESTHKARHRRRSLCCSKEVLLAQDKHNQELESLYSFYFFFKGGLWAIFKFLKYIKILLVLLST